MSSSRSRVALPAAAAAIACLVLLAACGEQERPTAAKPAATPAAVGPTAAKPTGAPTAGGDWPQWGGSSNRMNVAPAGEHVPDWFDPGKPKPGSEDIDPATTKNVRWVQKLGSETYGGPVVAGGKVFVGTNNAVPRDPKYVGDRSVLMAFDEKTGAYLWELAVAKLDAGKANDWESLGITSTPTVEGNRLYVTTSRCEVLCLDVDGLANGNDGVTDEAEYLQGGAEKPKIALGPKDADIIWRYDMIGELGVFPHNASNCSVLVDGDYIYVCTSNGMDNSHTKIPNPRAPTFIVLDKKTGKFVAEDDQNIGPHIKHGCWSSPSLATVNGRKELFTGCGDGLCYAFDPTPAPSKDTTWLKGIWKFDCNAPERKEKDGKPIRYPDFAGPSEVIATPVFYKNRIYVAVGQDPEHGLGLGYLWCIDATKLGDVTGSATIWKFDKIMRSISTVAIADGLLYAADFAGNFYCIDAENGNLLWQHALRNHVWSSPMVVDGKVYLGDCGGHLNVFKAGRNFDKAKDLKIINVGSDICTTPVAAHNTLFVASYKYLYAVEAK